MIRLRVREVSEEKGVGISKLQRQADLAYRTVHRMWHEPDYDVGVRTLEKVSKVLGVGVCDLIEEVADNGNSSI